jgi:hypothetical protein
MECNRLRYAQSERFAAATHEGSMARLRVDQG